MGYQKNPLFNSFCEISLENENLISELSQTSKDLQHFLGISLSISSSEKIKLVLTLILQKAGLKLFLFSREG